MVMFVTKAPYKIRIKNPATRIVISTIGIFFRPKLYARFSTKYSASNKVDVTWKIIALHTMAITNSTAASTHALLTDTVPAAIGRLHFVGCFRSFSRSRISLMIYTTEETIQNATKAAIPEASLFRLNNWPLQANAANTRPFLM